MANTFTAKGVARMITRGMKSDRGTEAWIDDADKLGDMILDWAMARDHDNNMAGDKIARRDSDFLNALSAEIESIAYAARQKAEVA